jgi:hypothetical protein
MSDTDPYPDHPSSRTDDSKTKFLWIGFPVILIIWVVYYGVQSPSDKDSSFDRLNTLFSGLAFWGVVYAILLQKAELALQRRELSLTRSEIHGQKLQLQAQNLTLTRQRFENTFFSLLDLFSGMVNSMEISVEGGRSVKGRDCFSRFSYEFDGAYVRARQRYSGGDFRNECKEAFGTFYDSRQPNVDHYFRILYNIIKFVDTSEVEDKSVYIKFLRVQLSSNELKLIFYNCLGDMGSTKFKTLILKHELLDNLRKEILIDQDHLSLL